MVIGDPALDETSGARVAEIERLNWDSAGRTGS